MKVIAVSGWKRSGKDTLADYLIKKYDAKRIGFADPLKDKVAEQFDLNRIELDKNENKEKPILSLPVTAKDEYTKTIINFLFKEFRGKNGEIPDYITFISGVVYGYRSSDALSVRVFQLYWTWRALCIQRGSSERVTDSSHWVKQAVKKVDINAVTVISDARYKSEMEQLKEKFGDNLVTIRVSRFDSSLSDDPSERDLDDYNFDFIIENKSSLDEFYQKIDELMTGYGRVMGLLYAK